MKKLIKDKKNKKRKKEKKTHFFYVLFYLNLILYGSRYCKTFIMTFKDTVAPFIFLTFLVSFSQAMYKIYAYDEEVYWSIITIIGCLFG